MKAIQPKSWPTTRSTTTKNNKQESTKDEDGGSVPILTPPCTQLQLAQRHHIAFRIIDLATTNGLKGLVSTDLPGFFPFTSSKGNYYIMCMYDYDSNVIWSHLIKLGENDDLIIGINACYKVLQEANITSIIHHLDDEISNTIICVIKK